MLFSAPSPKTFRATTVSEDALGEGAKRCTRGRDRSPDTAAWQPENFVTRS
jgi:hypothetical protein